MKRTRRAARTTYQTSNKMIVRIMERLRIISLYNVCNKAKLAVLLVTGGK